MRPAELSRRNLLEREVSECNGSLVGAVDKCERLVDGLRLRSPDFGKLRKSLGGQGARSGYEPGSYGFWKLGLRQVDLCQDFADLPVDQLQGFVHAASCGGPAVPHADFRLQFGV